MDLTWSEVKVGSRPESGEERTPEATADFRESERGEVDGITKPLNGLGWKGPHRPSHSKPLPGEHCGVCNKNVQAARPL